MMVKAACGERFNLLPAALNTCYEEPMLRLREPFVKAPAYLPERHPNHRRLQYTTSHGCEQYHRHDRRRDFETQKCPTTARRLQQNKSFSGICTAETRKEAPPTQRGSSKEDSRCPETALGKAKESFTKRLITARQPGCCRSRWNLLQVTLCF